jgi:hypothetical protein
MKKFLLISTLITMSIACKESQLDVPNISDNQLEYRTSANHAYYYDGLGSGTYNSLTNEWEIVISEDFEFRPIGGLTWIPYSGSKKTKISCSCIGGAVPSTCNPSLITSSPIEYDCLDPCENGCSMSVTIANMDNSTLANYPGGGEFRIQ